MTSKNIYGIISFVSETQIHSKLHLKERVQE